MEREPQIGAPTCCFVSQRYLCFSAPDYYCCSNRYQIAMDNATIRHFTNLKQRIEASAKELARSLQQEPVLQLKYRGIPYGSK